MVLFRYYRDFICMLCGFVTILNLRKRICILYFIAGNKPVFSILYVYVLQRIKNVFGEHSYFLSSTIGISSVSWL